ncbi:MAG: hypothetical protein PF693_02905 [Spirochaetia bacterium]|jgi:hypothetical protein|nr:hypothetical protein [Spirochaetia bacterium]
MNRIISYILSLIVVVFIAFGALGCDNILSKIDEDTSTDVPSYPAEGISFTDVDPDADEIGGTLTIIKAVNEERISHYALYWGSDSTTKSGSAIAELTQTGGDVSHSIDENTSIPGGATHFLVFTKNQYGEMATCISLSFIDRYNPAVTAGGISFTDTDGDFEEIGGDVVITKAEDEFTVTHYVLYWGSDSTTKLGSVISEIAKTGSDVTYEFSDNTAIPYSATHLLVYTKNQFSEMTTGISVIIVDTQPGLRDTGPAGGLIFYINPDYETDGWRYLEAAPYGWDSGGTDPELRWGTWGNTVGTTGTLIGDGLANTMDLYNNYEDTTAAQRCVNSNYGDYSDRFLPSIGEMYEMYANLRQYGVGGFSIGDYWSSSESSAYQAYRRVFSDIGGLGTLDKNTTARVRAARRF